MERERSSTAMAICGSFVMMLLIALALAVLIVPSQPLFQPPAGPHDMDVRDLKISKSAIENSNSLRASAGRSDVVQSWNVLVGRRGRFRRLVEQGNRLVCDSQLKCARRKPGKPTVSPPVDQERLRTREILANYRLPQKHSTHFQSERMVPTGPNPLHNSNRSQVIFP